MFAFHSRAYRQMLRARWGLSVERLEDRTAPARSVSPHEILVGIDMPESLRGVPGLGTAYDLGGGLLRVDLAGTASEAALAAVRALPGVRFASPNYIYDDVVRRVRKLCRRFRTGKPGSNSRFGWLKVVAARGS